MRRDGPGENVERLVSLGHALSDPIRVGMLSMMAEGSCDLFGSGAPAEEGLEGICVCEFEGPSLWGSRKSPTT